MPVAELSPTPNVKPRWPAVRYPIKNGTDDTPQQTTAEPDIPHGVDQTPTSIPSPVYETVEVVPATKLPASTTHEPVPTYPGSAANLMQGYCTEPAYTIIDGPTAVWMPVVGCVSSKADCCPTATEGGGPDPTTTGGSSEGTGGVNAPKDGGAQFPISMLPSQGALTGCPKDYHTVGGTACCPSSYWLWSSTLGGQVPCFSSLSAKLTPPPIPDTLVDGGAMVTTLSKTSSSSRVPALTMSGKPTSAIVNIQFSMQYPVAPPKEPALQKNAKIGIGVGASAGGILFIALLWFLVRRSLRHRRSKDEVAQPSVAQRFESNVDMSRVAHELPNAGRTFGGKRYTGVSTASVNY